MIHVDFSVLRLMFHEFCLVCLALLSHFSQLSGRFGRTYPLKAPKGLPHLSILINANIANVRLAFLASPR